MATLSFNNLVGTAGEYYVCAELCRRGFLALLTPKNNPIFDVLVTSADGTKTISIQVKTRSIKNKQGWKLGPDMALKKQGLFVVLVNMHENGLPDFYVYQHGVLAARVNEVYRAYMAKPKKDGTTKKEVGFRWFDEISFKEDDRSRKNNWKAIEEALRTT
ncbi:aspartate-ammonia lyase [Desulfoprunum benzoelyticum]|uniref:Aspartate ammonia-lyase n=1 Tax=Desulfoprunum benzoelyticum TaxID=1506996 RepID=A0A840UUR4_9BACT|nr:aspartate-ammonia lyase [Desulfoprunum benzoelyticum]MBB5349522.1 hypothetical protein [Desulfoprunum benzoelyticum]MBM9531275.1 aspartate-ammonia lyase [Desulfoprunum benzoelyticum]